MKTTTFLSAVALSGSFACGDDIEPNEPDAASEPTLLEQLVGAAWLGDNDTALEFRTDGLLFAGDSRPELLSPRNVAVFSIEGTVMTITRDFNCRDQVGSVQLSLDGESLTVTSIADNCPGRRETVDATYQRFPLPETFVGTTLYDRMANRGKYIDDVLRDRGLGHSNCGVSCGEIITGEWTRKPSGRYRFVHKVFHHEPPANGSVGDLACTADWEVWTREVEGADVMVKLEEGLILLDTDCPYQPPANFGNYVAELVSSANGPEVVGQWDLPDGEAFPGWAGEGGTADPVRFCPPADQTENGYCLPTCRNSNQPTAGGTCMLPAPE